MTTCLEQCSGGGLEESMRRARLTPACRAPPLQIAARELRLVQLGRDCGDGACQVLVAEGLAEPWRGRRSSWCNLAAQ